MKKLLLNGEIDVNCYFIEYNNSCYIIDPGYEKERIINYVNTNNLKILGILLTHGHRDHIGAIDCFKVPVYIHKNEHEVLSDSYKNGLSSYDQVKPYMLDDLDIVKIDETTIFEIDDKKIEVIYTPGHTIGGVCYKMGKDLYTGDTLFKGVVGKWIFPTGNLEMLKKSVVNLIESLDDDIRVYPGHGESSTIGDERKYNHFYSKWK